MHRQLFERTDYSVVVKTRAEPPKPWKWEIYRAGTRNPIKVSPSYFESLVEARQSGKEALSQLLDGLFS
jgi:hypothetical protein